MTRASITAALVLLALPAQAQQTRLYGPDGRSLGTVVPTSPGSNRFYDQTGRSAGTSTTTGDTTTYYDARGNVIGRSRR
jgi:YD repeat-containing protein